MNLQERFDEASTEHMLAAIQDPGVEEMILAEFRPDYPQALYIGGVTEMLADFEVELFDKFGTFVVSFVLSWDEVVEHAVDAAVAEIQREGYEIPSFHMDYWVYLDNLCQEVLK